MDHDASPDRREGDPDTLSPHRRSGRAALMIGLGATFVILCGYPYLQWLEHPSLYHDDFMRASSLRNSTLGEALFRPFNEHMAPLFETVSYLAWRGAGRQLQGLSTAFMVASFVAFGATVGMLGALIRRETGSRTSALVAVALFCLSSVSAETVLWYSASSFQWAAAATLAAWYCAASATDANSPWARRLWLFAAAVTSLAAPAFSAIGILAAPLAGLRLLAAGGRTIPSARDLVRAAIPASGLAFYLLICASFRYREVLTESLSKNLDLGAALWAAVRAPAWALFPSLVGLPEQTTNIPGMLAAVATCLVMLGSICWCLKSRLWPLLLGGIALIVGGYLLTYAARAQPGDFWIVKVTRYHLFPQIGLICLVVAIFGGLLRKFDRGPSKGLLAATLFAAFLLPLQARGMRLAAEGPYRHPDQPRLLSAADRLEQLGKVEAITFDQFFRELDPVQPRWAPHPWPFNPIMFLLARGPGSESRMADSGVRNVTIGALSMEEREVIFGGMEATKYRRPVANSESRELAWLVATCRISRMGGERYDVRAASAYLEYQVDPEVDEASALALPGFKCEWPVEVWWAGASERWSPDRSVRWKPDPNPSSVAWAVPIDAFPHWRRGSVRRLRIVPCGPGPLAVGAPRFIR
jgi:hypothetical protein